MMPNTTDRPPQPVTVGQVVQSAYHWAHEGLPVGEFLPEAEVEGSNAWSGGDGLMAFLVSELVENTVADAGIENGTAHWEEARRRAETVLREVQNVYDALMTYGPVGPTS